jgi:glycosyltransferase involved in cell wall biosynthesis
MIENKIVTVVMPAYNSAGTLEKTYREIPFDVVDHVILVDDAGQDETMDVARRIGIRHAIRHEANTGYGGNLKTCYRKARELKSDIVVLLHPDYQYSPKLIRAMCYLIADGEYDAVLASRMLGKGARKGGMPRYKIFFNLLLTRIQNLVMGQQLSEYHSGFRAYSGEALFSLNFEANANDFVFDNEMLAQLFHAGYRVAEISCPTRYDADSSSINFRASFRYGRKALGVAFRYFMQKRGWRRDPVFGNHHPGKTPHTLTREAETTSPGAKTTSSGTHN